MRRLLTFLVHMTLDVPVRIDISWVVLLDARGLDLLETPLWEVNCAGSQVAIQIHVSQPETRSQSPDPRSIRTCCIVHDFDHPVVFRVTNCDVAVRGDLEVGFCNGCCYIVGVKVAASLRMQEADDAPVRNVAEWCFCVEFWLTAIRVEEPVVVCVFVVVACDLLLLRTLGVCLHVGVQ